jgi:ribosomal protein L24
MAAAKIKKGDTVVVLSGKDKGKTGEVTQSLPKDGKVVVVAASTSHAAPQAEPGPTRRVAWNVRKRRCTRRRSRRDRRRQADARSL